MNIANHNPNDVPWALLIFDLQRRFQELDLYRCKTLPDGGKGETCHGGCRILWPSSESDLWYRVISRLCLDFTLDSLSFTGDSADFDSVFIKTWSVSMSRLKILLLVTYVNSVRFINGRFWGKKWKHPEILFPSWYKNGLFKLTFFSPGNVFYLLEDCELASGWKTKQNRRKIRQELSNPNIC